MVREGTFTCWEVPTRELFRVVGRGWGRESRNRWRPSQTGVGLQPGDSEPIGRGQPVRSELPYRVIGGRASIWMSSQSHSEPPSLSTSTRPRLLHVT